MQDATPIACQAHKRAGQYCINRYGVLLIATRDGNGKHAVEYFVVVLAHNLIWSVDTDNSSRDYVVHPIMSTLASFCRPHKKRKNIQPLQPLVV